MKLLQHLTRADYVSLMGILCIWGALFSVLTGKPFLAILFHLVAFAVDCADGWVARRMQRTQSGSTEHGSFGLQLDTIIDALNYPIFSAVFAVTYIFEYSLVGHVVACAILAGSVLRLSRMATNGIQLDGARPYYEGVVTPHISLAVVILYFFSVFGFPLPAGLAAVLLITLSVLMISQVKTYKPKSVLLGSVVVLLMAVTITAWYFHG